MDAWSEGIQRLHCNFSDDEANLNYFTGNAKCNNDEVLRGIQIQPVQYVANWGQQFHSGASSVVALCSKPSDPNNVRTVQNTTNGAKHEQTVLNKVRIVQDTVQCDDGQYGTGIAFKGFGDPSVVGLQLQCASSAAPSDNMNHVITRFSGNPPGITTYRGNPNQPGRRNAINATEGAINGMPT